LGIGDWAQSPIPNPQSPIPNPQSPRKNNFLIINLILLIQKNYQLIIYLSTKLNLPKIFFGE
jgi:hypothetical protein